MTTQPTTRGPRICKRPVKNDKGEPVPCNRRFVDGRCGNEAHHVSKYKSGFCQKGWCEGSNPTTYSGEPAPTCRIWQTCPCDCHKMYDLMFAQSGLARELVNNSHWKPPQGLYWMPSPEERMALLASSRPGVTDAPQLVESPLPDAVPATLRRSYGATTTGRAARGELEAWVEEQCSIWVVENDGSLCTPQMISAEIGRKEGIKPPSVGAIGAVFDRWVRIEFATVERKPVRFTGFTELGVKLGLEGCKDRAKRNKKSAAAAAARRF
ncbi:MAG TPA: hypothetical protein VIY48_18980 [Candidatus Paceibacterota bacterium]